MQKTKLEFAQSIRVRSNEFKHRAELYFGDGALRAQLADFWERHQAVVERAAAQYWEESVTDLHVETMSALAGQTLTREALMAMCIHTTTNIFTATKETDWMKNFAQLGLASWLADGDDQMVETLCLFSEQLIAAIAHEADDVRDVLPDIQFLNRITMLQFEIVASFRTSLEARYSENLINLQGTDFVSSLAAKIDASLNGSNELKDEATEANDKITRLRSDTTAAAAISEQSAQSMVEAARAVGELQAALSKVGDGIGAGKSSLNSAIEQAEQSANDNAEVARTVSDIENVVRTIQQIAEQTNILALNATIEAARAGASGAGFAVVAQEVKNLSTQTAQATKQVADQIAAIQESSQTSQESSQRMVDQIGGLTSTNEQLLNSLHEQLARFATITDAVDETAQGAASIGELVANVSRDTDAVALIVEHLSSASRNSASQLSQLVDETGEFVQQIGQ